VARTRSTPHTTMHRLHREVHGEVNPPTDGRLLLLLLLLLLFGPRHALVWVAMRLRLRMPAQPPLGTRRRRHHGVTSVTAGPHHAVHLHHAAVATQAEEQAHADSGGSGGGRSDGHGGRCRHCPNTQGVGRLGGAAAPLPSPVDGVRWRV